MPENPDSGRSDSTRPHENSRSRASGLLLELALAVVASIVVSAALQRAVSHVTVIARPTYFMQAMNTVACAVVLLALLWVIRRPMQRFFLVAIPVLLAALTSLSLTVPLMGTRLYLGGLSVDQEFRTQYLTRLTSTPALADMNYLHVTSYYPAGWFWLAGRFAAVTGMPGWAAYKPFAIISMAVMSAVAFVLWKLVLPQRQAALTALATALIGILYGAAEPYAWIAAATIAPMSVVAVHLLRCEARRHWASRIGIGAFLGISALTYTLYCLFFALLLGTIAVAALIQQVRAGRNWGGALAAMLGRLLPIGLVAGAVAAVFWAPYLISMLSATARSNAAQHYLPADSSVLPTPMLQASALGVLCLIGAIWLLISFRGNEIATALGTTAVLVYVWYGLSTLALVAHTTLLAFRLHIILFTVLAPAGVLGTLALYRWLCGRVDTERLPQLRTVLFSAAVVGTIAIVQTGPEVHGDEITAAQTDYYPTGVNSVGQSDPSKAGAWNAKLETAIADMSRRQPTDLVVLSTYSTLLSYQPYWGFQQQTPHYANPLANYPRRATEIAEWTKAKSSTDLLHSLDNCPDTPPTVFVLERHSDGLHMGLHSDIFPALPNVGNQDVVFHPEAFTGAEFQRRDVGPFAVIVRKS